MKNLKFNLALIICLVLSSFIFAQNKWSAEFRPSISFPTENLVDSNIETGFGFEFSIGYRFIEHFSAYIGWGYNIFSIEDFDVSFDETGYTFGLQFIHFLGASEDSSYVLRAAAIYSHLELEDREGDFISDSGHGFGWQI